MDHKFTDLVWQLDESFIPLGQHKVFTTTSGSSETPKVVVPRTAEKGKQLPIVEVPTQVHLGTWPKIRKPGESEMEGDNAVSASKYLDGDNDGLVVADDGTFPHLVVSCKRDWMDDKENHVRYYSSTTLESNRALTLGVDIVPEASSLSEGQKSGRTAPKPHQYGIGEFITFWLRPREWRENQFMYMIREQFGLPLYELFDPDTDPTDIIVPRATEPSSMVGVKVGGPEAPEPTEDSRQTEAIEAEGATGADDDLRSDGGRDPGAFFDLKEMEDRPLIIDDVLDQPLDEETLDRWKRHGYLLDAQENRAIAVEVIQDLLGESQLAQCIIDWIEGFALDYDIRPASLDVRLVMYTVLRTLIRSTDERVTRQAIADELASAFEQVVDDPADVDLSAVVFRAIHYLGDGDIVELYETGKTGDYPLVELAVRPTAVYAALRIHGGEELDIGKPRSPESGIYTNGPSITPDDEGKKVLAPDGRNVGIISRVDEHGNTFVDPNPGIADTIMSSLGWSEDPDFRLPQKIVENVEEITDKYVKLGEM